MSYTEKILYFCEANAVNLDTDVYFLRDIENEIVTKVREKRCRSFSVQGTRQMGKTSLYNYLSTYLNEFNWIYIDLSYIPLSDKENIMEQEIEIYKHLLKKISIDLKVVQEFNIWYKENVTSGHNAHFIFISFFKEFIIDKLNSGIFICFDELDSIFWKLSEKISHNFLIVLRQLLNDARSLNLHILLLSVIDLNIFYKSLAPYSRYNKVESNHDLNDFECNQTNINLLAKNLEGFETNERQYFAEQILKITGGIPTLVNYCSNRLMSKYRGTIDPLRSVINDLKAKIDIPKGFSQLPVDFLNRFPEYTHIILDIYEEVKDGKRNSFDEIHDSSIQFILKSTGLLKVQGSKLSKRSIIFDHYYNDSWIASRKEEVSKQITDRYKRDDSEKPNICLINAGGTIGMRAKSENENTLVSMTSIDEFKKIYPSLFEVADVTPIKARSKDGANMTPNDWVKLAQLIIEQSANKYDGFVIAHGTDTLTYTASAISFVFGNKLKYPIVFVGSQAPHYAFHGDALINLIRASEVIKSGIKEVMVVFGNEVYRAVRSEKVNDFDFKGFDSPTHPALATISEDIQVNKNALLKKEECIKEYSVDDGLPIVFEHRILHIRQYPGLEPLWFDKILDESQFNIKGIVIESLGVGNLPNKYAGDSFNFHTWIESLKKREIPVIIASRYPIVTTHIEKYEPAFAPLKSGGAISAGNMTSSAALTKLMWLLPQAEQACKNKKDKKKKIIQWIKQNMEASYVGELDNENS